MKFSAIAAVLAPTIASAQWWAGAPSCAQSCLSSAFADGTSATSTASADWPFQTDYCDSGRGSNAGSCLSSGCSATPTALSSYASLSSSLCSQWSSCTSAGSTGAQTITYPAGSVTWGAPGGWTTGGLGQRGGHSGGDASVWSDWASAYGGSKTWTGGVVTVTGCGVGDGSPWYAGPGGGWNDRGGFNGWVGWGSGWSQGPTSTATVTYTTTVSGGGVSTVTGLATVAAAVSGDVTATETLGVATGSATATPNAAPMRTGGGGGSDGSIAVGMLGLALASVVGAALML